ncbi:MAG: thiamine-phosphate kinase [Vulcanimicrobiaceae bacterium]
MLAEDVLIDALRALVERPSAGRIHLGIGDDAAVWQPSRSHRSVITTDALVEGVHFTRALTWREIGWRAMASNISDIAAMGARPVLATIALGLPPSVERDDVLELYRGMTAVSDDARCTIVGGDVTRSPVLTLAITVVGEVRPSNLKTRAGAKPGDVLAVTGLLGASRAGLHGSTEDEALAAHRLPQPRWREGLWLGASVNVHAMMDISDGLSTDLTRLCASSNVGAAIDDVPAAPSALAMANAREEDPIAYALAGGEDFELLVAVEARAFSYLGRRFAKQFGRPLYRIGTVRQGSGLTMRKGAIEERLVPTGWDSLT